MVQCGRSEKAARRIRAEQRIREQVRGAKDKGAVQRKRAQGRGAENTGAAIEKSRYLRLGAAANGRERGKMIRGKRI